MPIVTFWSNNEKAIGQTVAASAVATAMAIEHNYKVILISADFEDDSMEKCIGEMHSNKQLLKSILPGHQINLEAGMDGLLKMAKSNRTTPEIIKDYTKIVFPNRLEVLYSSKTNGMSIEEQLECFKTIILNASKFYDQVIVDLKKGIKYPQILDILEISNAIVLNTEQGTGTLEKLFGIKEMQKYIKSGKMIWNICRYDKKSKYNIKNLMRTVWKKQPIYNIPYNTLLFESANEGMVAELLLRIRTLKNEDENLEMLSEIKKLVEGILFKYQELQMKM